MSDDIATKYRPTLAAVRAAFPLATFAPHVRDYGASYSISMRAGDKRQGWWLEQEVVVGGVDQWLEDEEIGEKTWGLGPPFKYKLIGFPGYEDKAKALADLIASMAEFSGMKPKEPEA